MIIFIRSCLHDYSMCIVVIPGLWDCDSVCKTDHIETGVCVCVFPWRGSWAVCRRTAFLVMFFIIQEDVWGAGGGGGGEGGGGVGGGGVCPCRADGEQKVRLNKWIAWRDAGAESWTGFTGWRNRSEGASAAPVEGIYLHNRAQSSWHPQPCALHRSAAVWEPDQSFPKQVRKLD